MQRKETRWSRVSGIIEGRYLFSGTQTLFHDPIYKSIPGEIQVNCLTTSNAENTQNQAFSAKSAPKRRFFLWSCGSQGQISGKEVLKKSGASVFIGPPESVRPMTLETKNHDFLGAEVPQQTTECQGWKHTTLENSQGHLYPPPPTSFTNWRGVQLTPDTGPLSPCRSGSTSASDTCTGLWWFLTFLGSTSKPEK